MSSVIVGAVVLGVIGGLLSKSIFVGIALPILLLGFFVMWKYMGKNPEKPQTTEEDSIPPVTVGNIPQQKAEEPTYYQSPKERV